ncbi:MAG: hypothetical protein ACYC7B_01565, partial [Burkholderiales bacterium]
VAKFILQRVLSQPPAAAPRTRSRSHKKKDLHAARAGRVLLTDEMRVRRQNTVIVKAKQVVWVLYKITDCVRMRFSSAHNRRSARTDRRPRKR